MQQTRRQDTNTTAIPVQGYYSSTTDEEVSRKDEKGLGQVQDHTKSAEIMTQIFLNGWVEARTT